METAVVEETAVLEVAKRELRETAVPVAIAHRPIFDRSSHLCSASWWYLWGSLRESDWGPKGPTSTQSGIQGARTC